MIDSFKIMLVWGMITIGIGIALSLSLNNFDCSTLPKGYWEQTCEKTNLLNIMLPLLPIGLGSGIILAGFKFFKTNNVKQNEVNYQ